MQPRDMRGSNGSLANTEIGAVRIEPGVELKAALVRLFYHELEGIIERDGRFALFTRKPLAPGFVWGGVESICSRAYLDDYCIHAIAYVKVELADKISLLTFYIVLVALGPVDIIDG